MKKPEKKYQGPTKFGEILSKSGAVFIIKSWQDAAFAQMEAIRAKMVIEVGYLCRT